MNHVLIHSILSTCLYGFRPQSSTQEALLSLTKLWHNSMEENGSNVCVFLDVAKAFDSVPHDRVIAALSSTGVSGKLLDWFCSYFSNRHQFVAIQGVLEIFQSSATWPVAKKALKMAVIWGTMDGAQDLRRVADRPSGPVNVHGEYKLPLGKFAPGK